MTHATVGPYLVLLDQFVDKLRENHDDVEWLTEEQIAKIVASAAGYTDTYTTTTFTDVPAASTFYPYIERLARRGIITGYNDPAQCPTGAPCFHPVANVTRGQTAKFIANTFFPDCQTPSQH